MTVKRPRAVQVDLDSSDVMAVLEGSSQAAITAMAGSGGCFVVADSEGGLQLLRLH